MKNETPVYKIDARSILYWARCSKSELLRRPAPYDLQLKREIGALFKLYRIVHEVNVSQMIRDQIDPGTRVWSNQIDNYVFERNGIFVPK